MKKTLKLAVLAVGLAFVAFGHGASAPPDPYDGCDATPCDQCGWNPLCYFYCC